MLKAHDCKLGGRLLGFCTRLRGIEDLPHTLQFWMAQVARDLLRLGVFFRAAALFAQIPGAARYQYVMYDDNDPNTPDEEDEPRDWVGEVNLNGTFSVLAECLQRLGAPGVLKQIPHWREYGRLDLAKEWKEYLDRQAKIKHGLLSVVAECLDKLVVQPGMEEIDSKSRTTWYEHWWKQMNE